MNRFSLFVSAGDIGGARALLPVLQEFVSRGGVLFVHENSVLPDLVRDRSFDNVTYVPDDEKAIDQAVELNSIKYALFSTSVHDGVPLKVARHLKARGLRVACLLDNWMNYRYRLEMDKKSIFFPDVYFMMDALAKDEAIKEGLPKEILFVTGQPAIGEEIKNADKRTRDSPRKICNLIFVSEPVEQDQSDRRGYTEKTVLASLIPLLERYRADLRLFILPHPRENVSSLSKLLQNRRSSLEIGLLTNGHCKSIDLVAQSDGVIGMASILLYQAWLMGAPVLSLQPNLRLKTYDSLSYREGIICINDDRPWSHDLKNFVSVVKEYRPFLARPELDEHLGAAKRVCDILTAI